MYVDIAIGLFFLPDVELEEYDLTGAGLREYAADMAERLSNVGAVVDKLWCDGWAVKVVANNLEARHPEVSTYAEAVERLKRLGIEEDAITDIAGWSDEGKRLWPVRSNLCKKLHKSCLCRGCPPALPRSCLCVPDRSATAPGCSIRPKTPPPTGRRS